MKLYKFYYKANKNDIAHDIEKYRKKNHDEYIKDKYPLYAFTADKKLYKEFKEERNMDAFIIIKSDIDKEDFIEYAETYRDAYLEQIDLRVKDDKGKVCEVPFVVTTYEQLIIDDVNMEEMLGDSSYFPPYLIFNKKIVKALKTLLYPFFYNTITGQPLDEDEEEYDNIEVSNNEFEILYSQFSGTFNWK